MKVPAGFPAGERAAGLTGRRAECGVLDRLVEAVQAGESRALVAIGEPGAGKTALLEYLAGRAPGCQVARASGVQSEMELAFAGLHQLCVPMLGRAAQLLVPQRDALRIRKRLSVLQHRRAQLMQARERQLHFRLHASGPYYLAPWGPSGQVVQQSGLAHAGLTAHHQGPALTGPHVRDEAVKHVTFAQPAREPCGLPDTRMRRHRPGGLPASHHQRPSASVPPGRAAPRFRAST